jgi:hypothetical protein
MSKKKSIIKLINRWAKAEGIKVRITPLDPKPKPKGEGGKNGQ